jgi:hypothetical protein
MLTGEGRAHHGAKRRGCHCAAGFRDLKAAEARGKLVLNVAHAPGAYGSQVRTFNAERNRAITRTPSIGW